jgi:HAD superfamily hydrolase (TIGR01662 family)
VVGLEGLAIDVTPIACVLLDVGGTLWPQHGPAPDAAIRMARLRSALPSVSEWEAAAILAYVKAADRLLPDGGAQDVIAFMRGAAATAKLDLANHELELLRRALCIPAASVVSLLPGAVELLHTIRRIGLRCAIVSNAEVRRGDDYRQDFATFGVEEQIHAYISSVDVGMRKPHLRPFLAALERLQCEPQEAVVIGDSERNDIEAAHRLGARSILVAIESPVPERTSADAIATDLTEVVAQLEAWTSRSP